MQLTITQELHLHHILSAITGKAFPAQAVATIHPVDEKPFNGFVTDEKTADPSVMAFANAFQKSMRIPDWLTRNISDDLQDIRNVEQRYNLEKGDFYKDCLNLDVAREKLASLVEIANYTTLQGMPEKKRAGKSFESSENKYLGCLAHSMHALNLALRPIGYSVALLTKEEILRGDIRIAPTLGDPKAVASVEVARGVLNNGPLQLMQENAETGAPVPAAADGSFIIKAQDIADRDQQFEMLLKYGALLSTRNRLEEKQKHLQQQAQELEKEFKRFGFASPRSHIQSRQTFSDLAR